MLNWKWDSFPPDLSALYMSAHFYAQGQFDLIYATPEIFFDGTPEAWLPHLGDLGLSGEIPLPYVYPPIWAALAAPLTEILTPTQFFQLIGTILIASIAGSVILAWKLAEKFALPLWSWVLISTAITATSVIAFTAVMHLQVQIFVTFLTLLAFVFYAKGHSTSAGMTLALAAALKLSPAGFVLIFLFDRNWRAATAFALTGGVVGAFSLILAGTDLHFAFLAAIAEASSGFYICSITVSADVFLHLAHGLSGLTEALDMTATKIFIAEPASLIKAANKVLLIAALVWLIRATTALPPAQKLVTRLFCLSLLINLFGPLGWMHYYLLQLFLLPALLTLLPLRIGLAVILGVATFLSWPASILIDRLFAGDIPAALINTSVVILLFVVTLCAQSPAKAPNLVSQPA